VTKPESGYRDLTDLQIDILDVIWNRGEATVAEVQEALLETRALAMTTVATLLSRLEKRGVVAHRTEGRQFVYRPAVTREQVRESMVSALTSRMFRGDVAALVSHLLTEAEISPGDLAQVERLIAKKTREADKSDV
jgi:BlaI family transcriptional regulator, penicillinase repressor